MFPGSGAGIWLSTGDQKRGILSEFLLRMEMKNSSMRSPNILQKRSS
jgi:hypothetical protein